MIMYGTKRVAKSLSITCFAITALLLATAQVSATTVSIADVTMESGSAITVPITIEDILYYGAGTIDLSYDPAVVHVIDVTGSSDSTVTANNIDNTTGFVSISAWNTGGMSGEIIFANVTFTSVEVGSTPLNLTVDTLQDTSYQEIPSVTVRNGSIGIESPRPPTPFLISGYIYYDNGTPCNDPSVNTTNLNTGAEWQAETSADSNYYQINLTSGIDLNATEILHFDATDGTNTNLTDHTITTEEVNSGGLFGFNLTLAPLDIAPYLTSYTITNTTISPNGDGIEDDTTIDVKFSESVNATILIENATGTIKTLYTGSGVTDPDPEIWNGTDDAGNIVANGTYYINITMEDGVNPLVYNNTRSISVTKGTIVSVFVTDVTVAAGDAVTVPIRIDGIIDYGTGTTSLTYNSTVVHVTDVTNSSDSTVTAKNIDNTAGLVRISAWNITGVSGDIVFANVIFTAVGVGSTPLNLTVETLQNTTGPEILVTIDNGSITVDTTAPVVNTVTLDTTAPNTGDAILVTVDATDNVAVTGVTAEGVPLTHQSGNIWNGTITAIEGTHSVNVSAVDAAGNTGWNNSTGYTATPPPSPCYIATATYGTPLDSRIDVLRDFRDELLLTNPIGKTFVSTYYRTSPPIADALRKNGGLGTVTRLTLITPLVYLSKSVLSNMLVVFVLLTGLIAFFLFRTDRAKILRPLLVGTSSILVFTAAIFSLGFIGYAIPFCATIGAYMLPSVIPLSVIFTVYTILKMHVPVSDNIRKHAWNSKR